MNFAYESSLIELNPAKKLKNPKVTQEPTLPFSQEEVIRILAACSKYPTTMDMSVATMPCGCAHSSCCCVTRV